MELGEQVRRGELILMEGALGQRLKEEFDLEPHEWVALADMIYRPAGRAALEQLWGEYREIAARYRLPLLVTTPTRRANQARVPAVPAVQTPSFGTTRLSSAGSGSSGAVRCMSAA